MDHPSADYERLHAALLTEVAGARVRRPLTQALFWP